MGLDEAIDVLGLTPPLSVKDARRAYLRLLKRHKPEADPEGFMRLREAYELICDVAARIELVRVHGTDVDPSTVEPDPAVDPEPEGLASAPASSPAREEADGGAKDIPALPWSRPVPEHPKAAAALLCEWIERARTDGDAPTPPLASALAVLWALLERRAFKSAGRLYRAIESWLLHVGGARGQLAWGLTQGLWEMRRAIPSNLFSPMVRGVATASPATAAAVLREYARTTPSHATALHRDLVAEQPQLAAVFGRYLVTPTGAALAPPPARRASMWWVWCIVLPMLLAARACTKPLAPTGPAEVVNRDGEKRQQKALASARELAGAAEAARQDALCASARNVEVALLRGDCPDAHREVAACAEIIADIAMKDLRESGLITDPSGLMVPLRDVEVAVAARCGPPAKAADAAPSSSAPASPGP